MAVLGELEHALLHSELEVPRISLRYCFGMYTLHLRVQFLAKYSIVFHGFARLSQPKNNVRIYLISKYGHLLLGVVKIDDFSFFICSAISKKVLIIFESSRSCKQVTWAVVKISAFEIVNVFKLG